MGTSLRVIAPGVKATDPVAEVGAAYDRLRRAANAEPYPSAAVREDRLARIARILRDYQSDFVEAIDADFGGRSKHETMLADIFMTIEAARHARRHLARWMKPQSAWPAWFLRPASARIEWQPLGVVAVVAPWNYPVNLALSPLVGAIAAGNRVIVKPSELTPKTSELLARLAREYFAADELAVVTGGPDVARAVVALPLDHILFTGSTRVGREVARAAAENLTPTTLELGGKSPAIIHPSYSVDAAVDRIMVGKLFNSGQTCIAPDYVLLPRGQEQTFSQSFRGLVGARYPELATNGDYSAMCSASGFERMKALLADAETKGARLETVCPGPAPASGSRKVAPVLVYNPTDEMRLMQEEIFGPLLPVVPYDTLDEAIGYVNARPRPLALYYFDGDSARATQVLRRTHSGGACVNDTLLHFAQEDLPFGGVGPSGMGRYHGRDGFEAFSHKKGVYIAGPVNPTRQLMTPPYGRLLDETLRIFIGGRRKR